MAVFPHWQTMSGAPDEAEQLRTREDEVEDLGDEEEDESFAEMSLYRYGGECHPSKVAECIAWKRFGGIPDPCVGENTLSLRS